MHVLFRDRIQGIREFREDGRQRPADGNETEDHWRTIVVALLPKAPRPRAFKGLRPIIILMWGDMGRVLKPQIGK